MYRSLLLVSFFLLTSCSQDNSIYDKFNKMAEDKQKIREEQSRNYHEKLEQQKKKEDASNNET